MSEVDRFYVQVLTLADGGQVYGIWDARRGRLAWSDAVGSTWVCAEIETAERQAAAWNEQSRQRPIRIAPPPPVDSPVSQETHA